MTHYFGRLLRRLWLVTYKINDNRRGGAIKYKILNIKKVKTVLGNEDVYRKGG